MDFSFWGPENCHGPVLHEECLVVQLSWVPWATRVSFQQFHFYLNFILLVSVICKEKESILEEEWWCRWGSGEVWEGKLNGELGWRLWKQSPFYRVCMDWRLPTVGWSSAEGCQWPHWVRLVFKYSFQKLNVFCLPSSLLGKSPLQFWPQPLFWISLPKLFFILQGAN